MINQDKKLGHNIAQAIDSTDQSFHEPKDEASSFAKAPQAFRTISEVSEELHVPQHVLRFWETRFKIINPLKRNGGRRYYRSEDVVLLKRIADLLYIQGYTIKGVQRMLEQDPSLENISELVDTANHSLRTTVANDTVINENQLPTDQDPQQTIIESLMKKNTDLTQILETVLEELQILRKIIAYTN